MKGKLRSSGGFTFFETLAALAVMSIMLLALGAGTAASVTVYRQSTAFSEANVLSSTLFQAISNELRFATDITTIGSEVDTFTSANYGVGATITNDTLSGRVKISGGDLIGEKSYTSLEAAADITYSSGVFAVAIVVTDPNQDFAVCSNAEFSITPLNP